MRLEFFPYPFIIGSAILAMLLAILWRQKSRLSYLLLFALFSLYLLLVFGATLFPIPVVTSARQSAASIFSRVNLIPFDYSRYFRVNPTYLFLREIVANILLALPFGFGIRWILRFRARHIFWQALAFGFGIETSQLLLCLALGMYYRGVDITDALLNALGVLCGYGLFLLFSRRFAALIQHFQLEPHAGSRSRS